MASKTICNRCDQEKRVTGIELRPEVVPVSPRRYDASMTISPPPPPAPIAVKWLQLRIQLNPMYISSFSLDICPDCCIALGLPTDGRAGQGSSALVDVLSELIYDEVQNALEAGG